MVTRDKDHEGLDRRQFLVRGLGTLAGPTLLSCARASSSNERFFLIARDRPVPHIVPGTGDTYAAQHLADSLKRLTGRQPAVLENENPGGTGTIILVGSRDSNRRLAELLEREPAGQALHPEGFLLKTAPGSPSAFLLAGADRVGAIYAVNELVNFYLEADGQEAWVPPLSVVENPAFKYRIFWTWDHSTNWALATEGLQENGAENPYMKPPEAFLQDYKKVVDYMSCHKLNGLIIWGFLRDRHGGLKEARELVQYAHERGVRILPGVGTEYYGGYYYEGDNQFSTTAWLSRRPMDLRLLDANGKLLVNAICPSKSANQQWLREGAEWLFKTFPGLGGMNLENGDFMACQTEDCRRARSLADNDPNYYWDMMVTQVPIIERCGKISPEAWFVFATYTGFAQNELWKHTPPEKIRTKIPQFCQRYPPAAVCQWTYSGMVNRPGQRNPDPALWPKGLKPPFPNSVGLLHQGSQWWPSSHWWGATSWGNNVGARYEEMLETIRYTGQRAFEEGLTGIEIMGEVSPNSPPNELNYLAFEEFCWHPTRSMDDFVETRLGRFYGGHELARRYVSAVTSDKKEPQVLIRRYGEAQEVARGQHLTADQRRRWSDLAREMARRLSLLGST